MMEVVKVYEEKFRNLVQCEPRILEYVDKTEPVTSASKTELLPEADTCVDKTILSCSCCKVQFEHVTQQREHYKLDWHRYNLQRKLKGQPAVTETEFEEKEEVSSISGSESESEEQCLESRSGTYIGQPQGRVCIASNDGHVYSIHRCLLAEKKQEITNVQASLNALKNDMWCVFLLGGGHFAGALFAGGNVLRHKTFHCYTVRAGQGGSQSLRDGKGAAPKSAGASLRRYNEQALAAHVASILETWKDDIARCALIPFRAAGAYNKNVLFGGKTPIIHRSDSRLRVIPFVTRRATFKEVKRVHDLLTSVTVYESVESLQKETTIPDEKGEGKRCKSRNGSINRAKSHERVERPLPCAMEDEWHEATADDSDEVIEVLEALEISFKDSLQQFDDSLTPAERRRKVKKPKATENTKLHLERQAKAKAEKERLKAERLLKAGLHQCIITANAAEFLSLLQSNADAANLPLDLNGNTALHICAEQKKYDFIEMLLQNDADVCVRNAKNQTPYTTTQDKHAREIFKRFAEDHPEKHNYNRAQIPLAPKLSEEELTTKKLKAQQQKKAKRDRAKEARKQRIESAEEEDERSRFAMLSDREKRALAAERRILSANGSVTLRCFECGDDMGGKVPYQYSNNQFCCIDCLKAHRMKRPVDLTF